MLYVSKDNLPIKGKPKVFFISHPADFDATFDLICDQIFKTHVCAIFYTDNSVESLDDISTDLYQMNLFVIPVSLKLLTEANDAMDKYVPFAIKNNIPILPILVDSGIETIYSRKDKFGNRQYLDYTLSNSSVSYEEKLKKYLDSVLVDDKLAEKIRSAFDAYIFLSYRKKDRAYADKLMRLIHDIPQCRDIAIWYDEFLVPGESFSDNILKTLDKSDIFALLVSPSLLEEPNGKPNYIMAIEYPYAKKQNKKILPIEMQKTNTNELAQKYAELPDIIKMDASFKERFSKIISGIATNTDHSCAEHNFLVGLAYLDGIDVEIDKRRALDLITFAAEHDLPEAMDKLFTMYHDGIGVELNYANAVFWSEKLAAYYRKNFFDQKDKIIPVLQRLAYSYNEIGFYNKALLQNKEIFNLSKKIYGRLHADTLTAQQGIVYTYNQLGKYKKALRIGKRVYRLRRKLHGKNHPITLGSLQGYAYAYGKLEKYQKALPLNEKAYRLRCEVLGPEHPSTLGSLQAVAFTYTKLKQYDKALECNLSAYKTRCKVLGDEHPVTLGSLQGLGHIYLGLNQHEKAIETIERVYALRYKILGCEHPMTIGSLQILAKYYGACGNSDKELSLREQALELMERILSNDHPDTQKAKLELEQIKAKAKSNI